MTQIPTMILALAIGIILGYSYFYGLWWTLHNITDSPHPYLLIFASFVIRLLIALTAFYLMLSWGWQFLAVGLLGFFTARMIVVRNRGMKPINLNKRLENSDGI